MATVRGRTCTHAVWPLNSCPSLFAVLLPYNLNSQFLALFISKNLCYPSIFAIHPLGHTLVLFPSLGTAPLPKFTFYSLIPTSPQLPPSYSHHSYSLTSFKTFKSSNPSILFQFISSLLASLPSPPTLNLIFDHKTTLALKPVIMLHSHASNKSTQ